MSINDWSDINNNIFFSVNNSDVSISNKKSNWELINWKLNAQSKQKAIYNDNLNIKKTWRQMNFFAFAE